MSKDEKRAAILKRVKKEGVKFIAMQFTDILGKQKVCEIPITKLEDALNSGLWFDGSSIEGFVRIHESDMFLMPDPDTYAIVPMTDNKVARIICDVYVDEKTPFEGDPRGCLKRTLAKAKEMGYEYFVGPELEFFFFKNGEASCQTTHDTAGYFDLAPLDLASDIKREVVPYLGMMGIDVEMAHHEVAPGQHEIDFRYGDALKVADSVITYKNIVKRTAQKYGLFASFMPKPVYGINGSGMHTHQSLWKNGENAFYSSKDEYGLSDVAKSFIAGQLHHARAICGVVAPTVNSYKRLVPGYEAPVYICWSRINRSALIRVPRHIEGKKSATRLELRCPDPSCNPYLAFSVMLAAGLDGVKKGMKPPEPVEEDVYDFDDEKLKKFYIKTLPGSLGEALEEMGKSELVKQTLGKHIYEKLTAAQREHWDEYRIRVTPWEIETYFPIL